MLGNNGLTLKDMTQGYATLANQGNKPTLHIVAQVQTANGTDLYNAPTSAEQTFEANNANLVTKALTGVVQRGTATEARATGHTMPASQAPQTIPTQRASSATRRPC